MKVQVRYIFRSLTSILSGSSGKTTLLRILARRTSQYGAHAKLTGDIYFGGKKASRSQRRDLVSFVPQEWALFGDFTVYETMWFSARLYFGYVGYTKKDIDAKISAILESVGLDNYREVKVGSIFAKGLSGGQKRRLSIAVELISSPSIILLDEPTTSLDSATALGVFQELEQLASHGHTVIATIHQPSSQLWDKVQNVMIMSQGYVAYNGPGKVAQAYFEGIGLSCPKRFNPSEFFIGVVTTDFNLPEFSHSYTLEQLQEKFESSEDYQKYVMEKIDRALSIDRPASSVGGHNVSSSSHIDHGAKQVSLFSQYITLTMRSYSITYKNLGLFFMRLFLFVFLAIVFGLVFLNVGKVEGDAGVLGTISAIGTTLAFYVILSITVIPFVVEDRTVYKRELKNGTYRKGPLVLSFISTFFITSGIIAIVASIITVFMCGFRTSFFDYFIVLWLALLYAEVIALSVAAVSKYYIIGIAVAATWFGTCLITCGFFVKFTAMNWVIRWIGYVNPQHYFLAAQVIGEFSNRTIEIVDGVLFQNQTDIYNYYDIGNQSLNSFWGNWLLGLAIFVGHIFIFYFLVKFSW